MKSPAPSGEHRSVAIEAIPGSTRPDPSTTLECPIEFSTVPPVADGADAVATCASVLGELTHGTKLQAIDTLTPHCDGSLVVDLSGVTYFDAGGITVLLTARDRCRTAGRTLVVERPTPHIRWVLGLVRLDQELLGVPAQDPPRLSPTDGGS